MVEAVISRESYCPRVGNIFFDIWAYHFVNNLFFYGKFRGMYFNFPSISCLFLLPLVDQYKLVRAVLVSFNLTYPRSPFNVLFRYKLPYLSGFPRISNFSQQISDCEKNIDIGIIAKWLGFSIP